MGQSYIRSAVKLRLGIAPTVAGLLARTELSRAVVLAGSRPARSVFARSGSRPREMSVFEKPEAQIGEI